MVGFKTKLNDVAQYPFMLSIYKDDDNFSLVKHSMKCWENSQVAQYYNKKMPILYCRHVSIELLIHYDVDPVDVFNSNFLYCPKILKWAFKECLNSATNVYLHLHGDKLARANQLIDWDDEMITDICMYHPEFKFMIDISKLTNHQNNILKICS